MKKPSFDIFIDKRAVIAGVFFCDFQQQAIAGTPILPPMQPRDGDSITIVFREKPVKVAEVKP